MDRPKSIVQVSVKMPLELLNDLEAEAARRTQMVRQADPNAAAVTVSEVMKDCCEFRLTVIRGLRLGYYDLRLIAPGKREEAGSANGQKVGPPPQDGEISLNLEGIPL